MSSLRGTGSRSLIIICDCGEEHKLTADKNGEYQLGTTAKKPVKPATVEPGKRKRKFTIFDGFGDDDEEAAEKDDDD